MSIAKTPINSSWGPLLDPAPGTSAIAVTSVPLPDNHLQPFDFRSGTFRDDAQTLAHATGLGLEKCRQELFIAEGDVAMAYELLTVGYGMGPASHTLH